MSLFFAPSRKLAAARLERGGPRIYDPRERVALGAFDFLLRAASPVLGLRPRRDGLDVRDVKRILALRLDRLGDFLTTLPALKALRAAAPGAHLELAVGSWNEPIARRLPFVDSVRIVDTPWAAWGKQVRFQDARKALRGDTPDLAIDFQGDVRVLLLMASTRATLRAGYGDTGGGYLLTHRGQWDETKSWYWQNLELVRTLYPDVDNELSPVNFVTPEDREHAKPLIGTSSRPLIGIHPSAGRAVKQWELEKFAALADELSARARVIVTGASADRALVETIAAKATSKPETLVGTDLATFAAVVERFDVFVTGDTGPMHLSHAVGTSNVAIFGPSDPVRYGPSDNDAVWRHVVRQAVYCSPCNMIRRPPTECARATAPECIAGISVEQVLAAVADALAANDS
ncbi:MAG: lipopolysaccharide heptosyltransferase II [Acidobacteriota bacterium]|nr:MAG: lipopolysaccharide heptosyltransferase II [Acidobacteriota bacterium]